MRRRRRASLARGGAPVDLAIEALGGRGDGVARLDGRPVYVPLTVAGDRVRARVTGAKSGGFTARVVELIEPGPGRVAPPCRHFGTCGGCALQHLDPAVYGAWKLGLVSQALTRRGLAEVPIKAMLRIPAGTRRRATLAAVKTGGRVSLGFHQRASQEVTDLTVCLLLTPRLFALLAPLRGALAELLRGGERATVTLTETEEGPDVLVVSERAPGLAEREALSAFAEAADLARLSWGDPAAAGFGPAPEPLVIRRPPRIRFAGVSVEPPPGGFLQPSVEGQAALCELVLSYLPDPVTSIAELHAGCGGFTFALAERGRVHAVERDQAALAALRAAAQGAGLTGRITLEARDLSRAPMAAGDLAGRDCVVFDPPRAGAREQAAALAESAVATVIAVSCNPNSFARDARILVDGGYSLIEVSPVDQFPWSHHLELVALFRRKDRREPP